MKFRLFILLLVTCSLLFHSPPDFEAFGATNSDGTVKSAGEIDDDDVSIIDNNDLFGWSVENIGDLDGDGVNDLAVGAPRSEEPNSANNEEDCCVGGQPYTNRGAVHILFMNANGSVKSTAVINDATTNGPILRNGDQFGYSLQSISDLNGDGIDDLVAGAFSDNGSAGASPKDYGNIHILFLNRDGSLAAETVEVRDDTTNGPNLAEDDGFGSSIANIGDFDGNGFDDLAVGANFDDAGAGNNRGTVHILFMNTNGAVASTVEINSTTENGPTLTATDRFGTSVANIGDLDGDGVNDLAVGARNDDMDENGDSAGAINRGAVHIVFMNTNGSVKSTVEINDATVNGPTLNGSDFFGDSVENVGDLDGDGVNDLAVGASGDNAGGNNRGTVHIMFMNTDGSVKSTVEINSSTANGPTLTDFDRFGVAISNIGDLDDNGITDLAVGANQGGTGTNRGAIHIVFMQETDKPTVTITSSSGDCGRNFDSLTTLSYTATFNESTSNFVVGDITVTGTANYGSPEVSNFAGSGTTYTFDVAITSDGTALVSIADGVATDAAGNDNTASNSCTFTIDIPDTAGSMCVRHVILGNCGTIAINSDVYRFIDPLTNVPTTEVLVGQPVTVTLSTPDEPTHTKIHFASVHTEVFALPLNYEQSAHIEYSIMNNKITYASQSQLFQIAGATHRISEDTDVKNLKLFEVVFTMIFAKPMDTSHVVVETKNAHGIPETLYLMNALKVNENLAQALTLEEKSKFSIIDPELEMDPEPEMESEMDPEPEPTKKEKKSKKKRR